MDVLRHWTVDVQQFKEAVWAVERENFRPGDALNALERAKVDIDPASQLRGAVERAEKAEAKVERLQADIRAMRSERRRTHSDTGGQ